MSQKSFIPLNILQLDFETNFKRIILSVFKINFTHNKNICIRMNVTKFYIPYVKFVLFQQKTFFSNNKLGLSTN